MVADVASGAASSTPSGFADIGGTTLFAADDGIAGSEPWVHDLGATVKPIGTGCGAIGRVPRLWATDPVLGATMIVSGDGATANASGFLLIGSPVAPLALPASACFLYLDVRDLAVLAPFAPTAPTWTLNVPLPLAPALSGLPVGMQALLGPTNGAYGVDLTNGVFLVLGS